MARLALTVDVATDGRQYVVGIGLVGPIHIPARLVGRRSTATVLPILATGIVSTGVGY